MNCIFKKKKKEYIPENPYVDVDVLRNIYKRLENHNKIELIDFKKIEILLETHTGKNHILEEFDLYEISSYEEYIQYLENKGGWLFDEQKIRATRGPLKGTITGTISALMKYLK